MSAFRIISLTALACFWCVALLALRFHSSGSTGFSFLIWNLFLAAIPLGFSLLLEKVRHWSLALPLLASWLLFFPNAPYVLTDLVHLRVRGDVPLWLDLLMLLSFALVSLWMGFQSLRLVQHWVARRTSTAVSWLFVLTSLILSGFGIYLGRFLRWNSWDIISRPGALLGDITMRLMDPLAHGRTWGVTLGFGGLLIIAYLFWIFAAVPARQEPSPARHE